MTQFIQIEEIRRRPAKVRRLALWDLGFRPFYLLASIFAALSVPLWALQFTGRLPAPALPGAIWHAHEMIFGFALAVITGFLFTAGRNWTGRPTPTGAPLVALALLWVAARVLAYSPWTVASAAANAVFAFAVAAALAMAFIGAGNRRNYFFIALMASFGVATLTVHLVALELLAMPGWLGIQLALDMVLIIMVVMAGRVVPMFTNNAVTQAGASRHPLIERAAHLTAVGVLAADLLLPDSMWLAAALLVCCVVQTGRWLLWRPWKTLGHPLVWVLHLAYLWIAIHLALRAAALQGWMPGSLATHALTVGAIGGLIIGMMTRTAGGHTGRPLVADRLDVASYLCIAAAALVRVLLPLLVPSAYMPAIMVSAVLWSAGFGLYAVSYWPVLTRPRLDGLAG